MTKPCRLASNNNPANPVRGCPSFCAAVLPARSSTVDRPSPPWPYSCSSYCCLARIYGYTWLTGRLFNAVNFVRDAEGPNSTACAGIPPTAYLASACKPGDSAAPTQTADGKACASITLAQKAGKNLDTIRIALNTNLKSDPKIAPANHHLRIYPKIRKTYPKNQKSLF